MYIYTHRYVKSGLIRIAVYITAINVCPHLQFSLYRGNIAGKQLRCNVHSWAFTTLRWDTCLCRKTRQWFIYSLVYYLQVTALIVVLHTVASCAAHCCRFAAHCCPVCGSLLPGVRLIVARCAAHWCLLCWSLLPVVWVTVAWRSANTYFFP